MTEVKTKLAELSDKKQSAHSAWHSHSLAVEREARKAAALASEKVRTAHKDETDRLLEAKVSAERAWRAEVDATSTHEWEGKKVAKTISKGRTWNRSEETIYGIVEVRKSDTSFAENVASYSIPGLGDPFVRLLNKDGSVGKRIYSRGYLRDWKLAE